MVGLVLSDGGRAKDLFTGLGENEQVGEFSRGGAAQLQIGRDVQGERKRKAG
jgi:hypothetical protein